jgi:hypothetical protein
VSSTATPDSQVVRTICPDCLAIVNNSPALQQAHLSAGRACSITTLQGSVPLELASRRASSRSKGGEGHNPDVVAIGIKVGHGDRRFYGAVIVLLKLLQGVAVAQIDTAVRGAGRRLGKIAEDGVLVRIKQRLSVLRLHRKVGMMNKLELPNPKTPEAASKRKKYCQVRPSSQYKNGNSEVQKAACTAGRYR